jgi:cyclohexadienyl dehydratase
MNRAALAILGALAGILMHVDVAGAQSTASAPSRLDEILSRGTLRACTTGDYKPYSFLKGDGQFEGIDIDMT